MSGKQLFLLRDDVRVAVGSSRWLVDVSILQAFLKICTENPFFATETQRILESVLRPRESQNLLAPAAHAAHEKLG